VTNPQVSYEELTLANAVSINALLNVLERKGILKRDEVLKEVDELKRKLDEDAREN
jgi:hypothetical protein